MSTWDRNRSESDLSHFASTVMPLGPQPLPDFTIRNSRTSPALFLNPANRRVVHQFLGESPEVYWNKGRSQAVINRQISGSWLCFGVFALPLPPEGKEGAIDCGVRACHQRRRTIRVSRGRVYAPGIQGPGTRQGSHRCDAHAFCRSHVG